MKYIDEFRNAELAKAVIGQIQRESKKPVRLMEFCGGHTVAILKHGIRQLVPDTIELLSGPGCPVCVTASSDLDKAIALARQPGVIITSFGDMLKVPASRSSLQRARADGADVRIVYSTLDALQIARGNPQKSVVFLGVGFETTAPTVAASILQAQAEGLDNYYIISMHKLCPPVIKALLDSGETRIDGLICPGHVSAVTGSRAWEFAANDYHIACVVSGFEPLDILQTIYMLVGQLEKGTPKVETAYRRGVKAEGNLKAQELMMKVFAPGPANWRGIGVVENSGLKLRPEYRKFDAEFAFNIEPGPTIEPKGCICGDILRGVKTPIECKLFNKVCTPENPVGPCMVSSEGSCAGYYQYGNIQKR